MRYIGWMLSDRMPNVRHEALKSLTKLYRIESMVSGLRELTERFKARVVEMALKEKDRATRQTAIELTCLIASTGLLVEDDLQQLSLLLFSEDDKSAAAIASTMAEFFEEEFARPAVEDIAVPKKGTHDVAVVQKQAKMKALSEFLSRSLKLAYEEENGNESPCTPMTLDESPLLYVLTLGSRDQGASWYSANRVAAAMTVLHEHLDFLKVHTPLLCYTCTHFLLGYGRLG